MLEVKKQLMIIPQSEAKKIMESVKSENIRFMIVPDEAYDHVCGLMKQEISNPVELNLDDYLNSLNSPSN